MLPIDVPAISAEASFLQCVDIIRNQNLKKSLRRVSHIVREFDGRYQDLAGRGELYMLANPSPISLEVAAKDLVSLYDSRLAKIGCEARRIYDQILSAAPDGICPFCAQRVASTIDHYLPKSLSPIFSVSPANLVPSCSDCNHTKHSGPPSSINEQFLHPYFDRLGSDVWLFAEIREGTPAGARFFVSPPSSWQPELGERVRFHFRELKLGILYSVQAASELAGIRSRLVSLSDTGGAESVMLHLEEEARSRYRHRPNSWVTAIYRAWAESTWFVEGGFRGK